eukprot:66673-Rhodomonas_salina.13
MKIRAAHSRLTRGSAVSRVALSLPGSTAPSFSAGHHMPRCVHTLNTKHGTQQRARSQAEASDTWTRRR